MDICIDSNVFSHAGFLQWVGDNDVSVFLSSVAYMETSYHEMKRFGGSVTDFNSMLDGLGITIVPFDGELALMAAEKALIRHDLRENARDYAIGSYACKHNIPMITNNKKHFTWLKEVYTPDEFMASF
jgi:hypothetical protein